jgi:hypothetical protein
MLQLGKAALAAGTVIFMSRWMGAEGRGEIISKTNSTEKSPESVHQKNRYVSILLVLHDVYK